LSKPAKVCNNVNFHFMRYATFSTSADSTPRPGLVDGDHLIDVAATVNGRWPGTPPATLLALIEQGPAAWQRMADLAATAGGRRHSLDDIRWHAPIPRPPKNIFCLGLNYLAHAKESAQARGREAKIPEVPVIFTKAPTTVNGPFDDVRVDRSVTEQVDWEVELGVIIGRAGRDIRRADALRHVFGYTVINDVSARDLQQRHLQWFKGKSLDGFCPFGPVVVTADEFGDPQRKRLQSRVNGITKQDANTASMIFPVDVIIEWLSKGLTLEPGDIIATGTPEGVGMGRTPPEFLKDGYIVEAEVEGIGSLRNRIVDAARA
jgi:2-keto-4-pentenoate hydratase/2-oxohepta-3-ene-1,7-dioic acid hydratase in catechol pathway